MPAHTTEPEDERYWRAITIRLSPDEEESLKAAVRAALIPKNTWIRLVLREKLGLTGPGERTP